MSSSSVMLTSILYKPFFYINKRDGIDSLERLKIMTLVSRKKLLKRNMMFLIRSWVKPIEIRVVYFDQHLVAAYFDRQNMLFSIFLIKMWKKEEKARKFKRNWGKEHVLLVCTWMLVMGSMFLLWKGFFSGNKILNHHLGTSLKTLFCYLFVGIKWPFSSV